MRYFVFYILCFTLVGTLSGCGQSGALMLPSDPNYDKRSQYILHGRGVSHTPPQDTSSDNISNTDTPSTDQN